MSYDNCSFDLTKLKKFCEDTNVYFDLGVVLGEHLYKNLSITEFNKIDKKTLKFYKDAYSIVVKYFEYFQEYSYTKNEKLANIFQSYVAIYNAIDYGIKFIDIGTEYWSPDNVYDLSIPMLGTFDNDYNFFITKTYPFIEEWFVNFESEELWGIFNEIV